MQRVTISLNESLAFTFDKLILSRGYKSRSEAVRDAVREAVERWSRSGVADKDHCVACVSYIYSRRTRGLPSRLSEIHHGAHDLVVAVTHMPMDHHHTMETVLLRGEAEKVRALADQLCAERGVRFGSVNAVGVEVQEGHGEAAAHDHQGLAHFSPRPG